VGGTTHLPVALFAHAAGIDLLHVPYKGAAQALQDTIQGTVALSAPGYSAALNDPIKEGTIIPLAVTSAQRLPFLPEVPTLVESGYPDMAFPIWYALFAPTGTPQPIIDRVSAALKELTMEPEFIKKMYAQGNHAAYVPPEALAKRLSEGTRSLGERLKASGINVVE
jgi:tripartite-type tricarboxylate transporter receptor subunit TctC